MLCDWLIHLLLFQGDGGAPLFIRINGKAIQVGLSSYGIIEGCQVGYPSAFTRISSYIDWIEEKTGIKFQYDI